MSEWDVIMGRVASAIREENFSEAIADITTFLEQAPSDEDRREALAMRGTLRAQARESEHARRDLVAAHNLSNPGSYSTYTIELGLAKLAEDKGDVAGATEWYLAAMRTAIAGEAISAGAALEGMLRMASDREMTDEESKLAWSSCRASWRSLGLDRPIPADIAECVGVIVQEQQIPRR